MVRLQYLVSAARPIPPAGGIGLAGETSSTRLPVGFGILFHHFITLCYSLVLQICAIMLTMFIGYAYNYSELLSKLFFLNKELLFITPRVE